MKILVTGANGMLGQDLCPILEDEEYDVIETDVDNLDITDSIAVNTFVTNEEPDFIIHCAAYTNVDKAEEDFDTAILINETGTRNIAAAAKKNDIPILYISTDYVFDGTKKGKYTPSDATNPINKYGLSKLKGEESISEICDKYYIVRTSWLYGHHGKNFVETMIDLATKNTELNVVNDQVGCPTWTVALCEGIVDLIDSEADYGIYHICGSGSCTWYEFAKKIFEILNIDVKIKPVTTQEFPRAAKRPKYSVMDNDDCCPNWEDSLKMYLNLRSEE